MKRIILAVVLLFSFPAVLRSQTVNPVCPTGWNPLPGLTGFDGTNNIIKQQGCIDTAGDIMIQLTGTLSPVNSGTPGTINPTGSPYNLGFTGGKIGGDGTTTNLSPNLASAHASCQTADIGKAVSVVNPTGNAFVIPTGSITTITGCSGASWVMSANANASVAGNANWGIASDAGPTLQTVATAALGNAATLQAGQGITLPCGVMALSTPPFNWGNYSAALFRPNIQGCNAMDGTIFILLPTISAGLPNFGCMISCLPTTQTTGAYNPTGLGPTAIQTNAKVENLMLIGLGGLLPSPGGNTYNLFNGYYITRNVMVVGVGMATGGNYIPFYTSNGDAVFDRIAVVHSPREQFALTANGGNGNVRVTNSLFAYNTNPSSGAVINCTPGTTQVCTIDNTSFINNNDGVIFTNNQVAISNIVAMCHFFANSSCISDNGANSQISIRDSWIQAQDASSYAFGTLNNSTTLLISGTHLTSPAGFNVNSGSKLIFDGGGNTYSSAWTQFGGRVEPLGGGSAAMQNTTAALTFGTTTTAQNLIAATPYPASWTINAGARQIGVGTGCGAGSNTVTPTLSWTSPQGFAQTLALNVLSISANGTADSGSTTRQTVTIQTNVNTAVTISATSVLASVGCTGTPTYSLDFSVQ